MTTVGIVQARLGSTRLPGKVLHDIAGAPMLDRVVRRAEAVEGLDAVVVATTVEPADDAIATRCNREGWQCFRGDERDVLGRYVDAARRSRADHVMRITADCPFVSPDEAARLLDHHLATGADYSHNLTCWGSGMPLGTGTEVFTFDALERSSRDGREPHHREHVDEYVYEHPETFSIETIHAPPALDRPELRLTVDTAQDLEVARAIYRALDVPGRLLALSDVVALLDQRPDLALMNRTVVREQR